MTMTVLLRSLDPLVDALRVDGYRVVGPARSGDTIVVADLAWLADAMRRRPPAGGRAASPRRTGGHRPAGRRLAP